MRSAQSKIVWDGIVTSVHPDDATSNNTILSIIDNENTKLSRARLLRFYASASPSKELRDASNAATTLLNNGEAKLYSRTDVFLRVVAVAKKIQDFRSHTLSAGRPAQISRPKAPPEAAHKWLCHL